MTTSARPTHLEDSMYQTRRTTIADRSCEQVTTRSYEALVTEEYDRGKVRGHQRDSKEVGAAECTYKMGKLRHLRRTSAEKLSQCNNKYSAGVLSRTS